MKITCPRCGEVGYLVRVKVGRNYYVRVEHVENGKRRICYLGRDVESLRRYIESVFGSVPNSPKIIPYAGGDFYVADLLLPRLESLCPDKCTFVEVFGGSGYMSQVVPRTKYNNVVYNDVNNLLVTLYKHIKENPEVLTAIVSILPYSRSYFKIIQQMLKECKDFASLAVAAMAFYIYNASFNGMLRSFSYSVYPNRNKARSYRDKTLAIIKYAVAWRDVTIENLDFRDVIRRYDSERTVFYLDPPYPDKSKDFYGIQFTANDLREMANMLTQLRGRFLLKLDGSTYELISDILPNDKYSVETFERRQYMSKVRGGHRGTWTLVLVSSRDVNVSKSRQTRRTRQQSPAGGR
jgi:DNA adenine methylase